MECLEIRSIFGLKMIKISSFNLKFSILLKKEHFYCRLTVFLLARTVNMSLLFSLCFIIVCVGGVGDGSSNFLVTLSQQPEISPPWSKSWTSTQCATPTLRVHAGVKIKSNYPQSGAGW